MTDNYPRTGKTLYLNILWHQHQPLYLDPETDQLQGPWVRTHGTKDYYDLVAVLQEFPDIHFTVNLTSSLLFQLEEYYVNRLKPFVDTKANRVNAGKYFAQMGGKTDPWIDLALKPTEQFDKRDIGFLLTNVWNAFGVSPVVMARYPRYASLKEKFDRGGVEALTVDDRREVKFWFYVANFDPDFLERGVTLTTGEHVGLQDIIQKREDGSYWNTRPIIEEDCNRIVAETFKILSAIVPIHRKLMLSPDASEGQVEVITTPYYHPILPLIYDSDLAKLCQPYDPMPTRYNYPKDAEAQVAKAVQYFTDKFGVPPRGMWPAEGAVAHDIVAVLGKNGIRWIATDEKILHRSRPAGQPKFYPYGLYAGKRSRQSVAIAFRDTELSDKIGFVYKHYRGEDAAEDFIQNVLRYVPPEGEPDRLLSVILDGENAWEWYQYDNDGKEFQRALYRKLSRLYETGQVVTTTMTEYLDGNPRRNIPPHPIDSLPRLEWLWPGSWINANFDTWIGGEEENRAWEYLREARELLEKSGLRRPDPRKKAPRRGSKAWYAYQAWESLYAAEGSDWFWWYGTDQSAPSGEKPFDHAFITFLNNACRFAEAAGGTVRAKKFAPIAQLGARAASSGSTMAQSEQDLVTVLFQCDARGLHVERAIYVVGNHPELGSWKPNLVQMYDDGSHGDRLAGDGIWSLEVKLPQGAEIEYKFTNSGPEGEWHPGEELPFLNRRIRIEKRGEGQFVLFDRFGTL